MKIALLNLESFVSTRGIKFLIENLHDDLALICLSKRFGGKYGSFLKQALKNYKRAGLRFVMYQSFNLVYFKPLAYVSYFINRFLRRSAPITPIRLLAKQNNIHIIRTYEPNDPIFVNYLKSQNIDLVITFYFDHILRKPLISSVNVGAINAHTAKLPMCKGAFPVFCSYLHNIEPTVTIHLIADETLDTGNILVQESYSLNYEIGLLNTEQELMYRAAKLMVKVINNIKSGSIESKQQLNEGFYMPFPNKNDIGEIVRRKQSLIGISKYVRAFYAAPNHI
ncbi:MAG: formyltransferase family protein [Patescibacteria group bacterium]